MSRNPLSRRSFLAAGVGATAVAATSLLPPSLQRALATPVSSGGLDSIEHVVLVMQENRSFDHYYGALRGVRGFGDPNALRLRGGHSVFEQPGPTGPVLPFPIRDSAAAQRMDTQNVTGLDHSWAGGHAALADGWHDGWIAAKTGTTMAYYDRQDIPFHYELADAFTICDATTAPFRRPRAPTGTIGSLDTRDTSHFRRIQPSRSCLRIHPVPGDEL